MHELCFSVSEGGHGRFVRFLKRWLEVESVARNRGHRLFEFPFWTLVVMDDQERRCFWVAQRFSAAIRSATEGGFSR